VCCACMKLRAKFPSGNCVGQRGMSSVAPGMHIQQIAFQHLRECIIQRKLCLYVPVTAEYTATQVNFYISACILVRFYIFNTNETRLFFFAMKFWCGIRMGCKINILPGCRCFIGLDRLVCPEIADNRLNDSSEIVVHVK
jgi:hypothetical protein